VVFAQFHDAIPISLQRTIVIHVRIFAVFLALRVKRFEGEVENYIFLFTSKIDRICSLARGEGANCKLTGAGGGGCAIILLPAQSLNIQVRHFLIQLLSVEKSLSATKASFNRISHLLLFIYYLYRFTAESK
jgi:hypothetical protein